MQRSTTNVRNAQGKMKVSRLQSTPNVSQKASALGRAVTLAGSKMGTHAGAGSKMGGLLRQQSIMGSGSKMTGGLVRKSTMALESVMSLTESQFELTDEKLKAILEKKVSQNKVWYEQ